MAPLKESLLTFQVDWPPTLVLEAGKEAPQLVVKASLSFCRECAIRRTSRRGCDLPCSRDSCHTRPKGVKVVVPSATRDRAKDQLAR